MIQKNNKMTLFVCVRRVGGGGGKINWLGQLASGGEDNQGGRDKIAWGQAVQGARYTGALVYFGLQEWPLYKRL